MKCPCLSGYDKLEEELARSAENLLHSTIFAPLWTISRIVFVSHFSSTFDPLPYILLLLHETRSQSFTKSVLSQLDRWRLKSTTGRPTGVDVGMKEDTFRPPASPTVAKQSREAEVEEAAQLSRRTSSGSVSSSSTPSSPTRSPRPSPLQQPNAATSPLTSPIKRTSPYSYTPSSPLSSVDSRRRQDSISSSGTTEATSVEESGGEDNMSGDGDGKEGSSSSSGTWSASGRKRIPQHSLLAPSSTNTTLVNNNSGSSPSSSVTNAIPIPLSSSNSNISLSTSLPASSVRLSTTPLFPSPLAQASGPDEDHVKGDDGDGESEEEEGLWDLQRIGKDSSALSRMHSVPFDGKSISGFGSSGVAKGRSRCGLPSDQKQVT